MLHVLPGGSPAAALRQALGSAGHDSVLGLVDDLACGPLPVVSSLDEWVAVRKGFWRGVYSGEAPDGDPIPDPAQLAAADEIVVWMGAGLSDQLIQPWLCWVLREAGADCRRVRCVQCALSSRSRPRPSAVGMLSPDDFRQQAAPVALAAEELAINERAWSALTHPSPEPLVEFLSTAPSELPLARALTQLARRYPQCDSGLSWWDFRLLSNALRLGPRAAYVVGHTMVGEGTELDCLGDHWLLWRLQRLARARCPLVTLQGDPTTLRGLSVSVTDAGRQVLESSRSAVDLNGIDDWVAGVHLDSTANRVWFADGDRILG